MNRCPITYLQCDRQKYSSEGLRKLSRNLKAPPDFPFTAQEQILLCGEYANKLSIAGVQPKLSLRLNVPQSRFEVVEKGGTYILKPPHPLYPELPENEDVTMRLASLVGIEVPFHGLIYGGDDSLCYLIRRFDRYGKGKKYAVEDFSQLSLHSRDKKYNSSMEKLIPILDQYCSFPMLEKIKLFRRTLFCFLVGNEDMHLKNFSLIRRQNKVEFAPAYDLLNSTLVTRTSDEVALPIAGKRSKLTRELLCDYYGRERLGISIEAIDHELSNFVKARQSWTRLIQQSFLSKETQERYLSLLSERWRRLFYTETS